MSTNMTTIHDEEKIQEIIDNYRIESFYNCYSELMKQYAEHIAQQVRLKTIDESIEVFSRWHGGYVEFVEQLEQLKK